MWCGVSPGRIRCICEGLSSRLKSAAGGRSGGICGFFSRGTNRRFLDSLRSLGMTRCLWCVVSFRKDRVCVVRSVPLLRRVILSAAKNPENLRCIAPASPSGFFPFDSPTARSGQAAPLFAQNDRIYIFRRRNNARAAQWQRGRLQFENPVGEPTPERLRRRSQCPSSAPCP